MGKEMGGEDRSEPATTGMTDRGPRTEDSPSGWLDHGAPGGPVPRGSWPRRQSAAVTTGLCPRPGLLLYLAEELHTPTSQIRRQSQEGHLALWPPADFRARSSRRHVIWTLGKVLHLGSRLAAQ